MSDPDQGGHTGTAQPKEQKVPTGGNEDDGAPEGEHTGKHTKDILCDSFLSMLFFRPWTTTFQAESINSELLPGLD